jgi:hypothetical protein
VENLQMTEESVENKLPVVFDRYSIKGQNFFFSRMMCALPSLINTTDGQMAVQNFKLIPLCLLLSLKVLS